MEDIAKEIELPRSFEISQVEKFHHELEELLQENKQVTFKAAAVNQIDGAAMQLLVAFFKQAEKQELPAKILSPSPVFCKSANLMGVAELLGCN